MNILEKIKEHKRKEVERKKELYTIRFYEQSPYFTSPCVSMKKYLSDPSRSGIIAEFKRQSPSKGIINKYADAQEITLGYMQAGSAALSVLTDEYFFGAKKHDLPVARKFNFCPLLQKDFILDEFQIIEARSLGADTILLIAALLDKKTIKHLSRFAKSLGMEVLLEIHNEKELEGIDFMNIDLIGINNRNLQTFEVHADNCIQLIRHLPENILKVAESGIDSPQTVKKLKKHGFHGFLIGEYFMRHSRPAEKCREFIKQLTYAD